MHVDGRILLIDINVLADNVYVGEGMHMDGRVLLIDINVLADNVYVDGRCACGRWYACAHGPQVRTK